MKHFELKRNEFDLSYKEKNDVGYVLFKTDFDINKLENFFLRKNNVKFIETVKKEKIIVQREDVKDLDIRDVITPLHKLSYEDQIFLKEKELNEEFKTDDKIEIIEKKNSLRNNFQFAFGRNPNFNETETDSIIKKNDIGFRGGKFIQNRNKVFFPENVKFIDDILMKKLYEIRNLLNDENLQNGIENLIFDRETLKGYLKMLMVRQSGEDFIVLVSIFNYENILENEEKFSNLKNFLKLLPFENISIVSDESQFEGFKESEILKLGGKTDILYKMCGFNFSVSYFSFFQTNVVNFEQIVDEINPTNKYLIDMCCGSGVIGICLSKKVEKILGIEINKESEKDFRKNQAMNDIKNYEFLNIDVNDFDRTFNENVSMVLDPPRAGVSKNVIKKIRNLKEINEIFYVSCDYKKIKQNIEDLCKTESKSYKNEPFKVHKIIGYDVFPETNKLEVLFLLKR